MDYDRFIRLVSQRLDLDSDSSGAQATRSTLQTLAERLPPGEATDLALALPREIDRYMVEAESGQSFTVQEFVERIQERSDVDQEEAVIQANIILYTVFETVPINAFRNARVVLPSEYSILFQLVDRTRNQEPSP